MTASTIYYESQYFTTTLSKVGGINASQTTGIVLQSVSGIFNTAKPGIALLNYADPLSTTTAEWVTFTSINATTKTLVGVTRGAEGFSAKTHDNGITVAFPHSKSHINEIAALLDGTNTGATLNTPTLTSPVINTGISGTAIDTDGTLAANSDTKLATQKAVKTYVTNSVAATSVDGWTAATGTWTYASASTITVPSGAAALYQIGDKIKLTQTTAKYFIITAVADTLLTVTAGTDYTVANAAITSPYYSHQNNPIGFPSYFNYTPTFSAAGGSPAFGNSTVAFTFTTTGRFCSVHGYVKWGSTANYGSSNEWSFSLPITASINAVRTNGSLLMYDSGTRMYSGIANTKSSTTMGGYEATNTGVIGIGNSIPFTWTTNDEIWIGQNYHF